MNDPMATPEFAQTAARWAQVAPVLGFGHDSHELRLVRACLASPHQRMVLLAKGSPDLIVKHSLTGQTREQFDIGVAAHRHAFDVFAGCVEAHVPALLYVDGPAQVLVMEAVRGGTAHDVILGDAGARARVLRACGVWIGHWHRETYQRDNPINPNTMRKNLAMLRGRVESGARPVLAKAAFLRCADIVDEMAQAARGQVTKLAATHGDMNMRNIMMSADGPYGIDFGAVHHAPIGHDLARFLADFASYFYPEDAADGQGQWFDADLDAFFAGYGAGRDDPSLRYLLRLQLLKDWANIPKDAGVRSWQQTHRWAGIQFLKTFLF